MLTDRKIFLKTKAVESSVRIKFHDLSDFRVHNPYATLTTLAFTRVQGCVDK